MSSNDLNNMLNNTNIRKKNLVKAELDELLQTFDDFKEDVKKMVGSDGIEQNMLTITGTISINKVPVQVRLSNKHPKEMPIVYVLNDDEQMQIGNSLLVDSTGRVNISKLVDDEKVELVMLINLLAFRFNDENPLVVRQHEDTSLPDELIKQSLVTAVHEKIKSRFNYFRGELTKDLKRLEDIETHILQNGEWLSDLLNNIQLTMADLEKTKSELDASKLKISNELKKLARLSNADTLHHIVINTNHVHRQIVDLYAEELAIGDFIFYLNQGLAHRTVSLDDFLKLVRKLARRQFFIQATLLKCQEIARKYQ